MIDFSQYSEVDPFITPELSLDYSNNVDFDYKELPFNDKRLKYIKYLDEGTNRLLRYLKRGTSGYAAQENTSLKNQYQLKFQDAQTLIELLDTKPSQYFELNQPIDQSGNCLGTDRAYDMFRSFVNTASRVQGLYTYEEYYTVILKDALEVTNQIFNVIGTRGQFFGYLDQQVKGFGDILNNKSYDLEAVNDDWKDILSIASGFSTDLTTHYNNFKNNILQAGCDMRQIINPIIKFLNMLELGSKLFGVSWGSLAFAQSISDISFLYSKYITSFIGDYFAEAQGNTFQITDQMLGHMNDDRNNLEFIMTKATSLSITDIGIRQTLEQIHSEMIIPNY